jgi:hypothetical protein
VVKDIDRVGVARIDKDGLLLNATFGYAVRDLLLLGMDVEAPVDREEDNSSSSDLRTASKQKDNKIWEYVGGDAQEKGVPVCCH